MKNTKKLLGLGLGLALTLGLMAGCAPAPSTATPAPVAPTGTPVVAATPAPTGPAAWTSVADLVGAKIAVQEGTTGNKVAEAIEGATVTTLKAATACAMELTNGRVDCVIIDTNPAKKLVEANEGKLALLPFPASANKETYAIATQKNDKGAALATEFSAAMKTLKENGTFDALVAKHIANDETAVLPALPTDTSKGKLVMGTNAEFDPFEYLNSDGDMVGFDIDYANYLCATMGYELTMENLDFDALIATLQSGRVDFLAAGLTKDEERAANANFTDGYYEAEQSIIVKVG